MLMIWKQFMQYWQAKGWTILLLTAIGVLFICWLISERNNIEGSYDKFDVSVKNKRRFQEQEYFPQSIKSNSREWTQAGIIGENSNNLKPYSKSRIPTNSKGEEICRQVLQELFNQPFPKIRPKFLFNSVTGENLELDMYNKDYKLAVEYNGQQHYKFNSFMHGGSKDKFYGQQYRDKMKTDIFRKLGICLIEVPYTVKHDDIPNFLMTELRKHRYIQ